MISLACSGSVSAQAYSKRSSDISLGYGLINVWKIFLHKVVDIPDYKITSPGVFTLIYEYGITKRFSAGICGSYSRIQGKAEKYQLHDQLTVQSLLARANYHFWTKARIDPYFGGGIGIINSKYKNLDPHTVIPDLNKRVPSTLNFSGQLGIKYFPSEHFGFYSEVGYVGGAIVHIGLTGKF